MRHERFEWDEDKATMNLAKHRVAFEEAAAVLGDPFAEQCHVTLYDGAHSDREDRWITIGAFPFDRSKILVVAWTSRAVAKYAPVSVTRIISARMATPRERKAYQVEVGP